MRPVDQTDVRVRVLLVARQHPCWKLCVPLHANQAAGFRHTPGITCYCAILVHTFQYCKQDVQDGFIVSAFDQADHFGSVALIMIGIVEHLSRQLTSGSRMAIMSIWHVYCRHEFGGSDARGISVFQALRKHAVVADMRQQAWKGRTFNAIMPNAIMQQVRQGRQNLQTLPSAAQQQ